MLSTPEFWVLISFIGFVGLIIYMKAPQQIAKALDDRADAIRNEIDEAKKLREEAQAVLAEYQRKRRDAEKEAGNIVTQAKEESERLGVEARENMESMLERRMEMAELRISHAEQQARDDVRAAAADAAIAAAERVIGSKLNAKAQNDLITESIKGVKANLN